MCVVKADAYGHGVEKVAPIMLKAGADVLGCATVDEAVALRKLGIDAELVAWMWEPDQDLSDALSSNIVIGVPSLAHAQVLVDIEVPVKVVIKVETGMHRNGVDPAQWDEVFTVLRDAEHIEVTGLMSHLAAEFQQAVDRARELGLECPINHLANSPATLTRKDLHFDQVRVGLACYGLEPVAGLDHGLEPAMTWAANIINVKPIKKGESSCYGLTWTAPADGYLAVVPVGYADGLPRSIQGSLEVTISGKSYPHVGRVSMDQIVVDLGENPFGVSPDDEVIIFGEGGQSATQLADAAGTINYEIVCRPTGRTKRTYEGGIDL